MSIDTGDDTRASSRKAMPRSLPRKRLVQSHGDADFPATSAKQLSLLGGKRLRWLRTGFLRRTRILVSLLRRYPVAIFILVLITWVALRLITSRTASFRLSRRALNLQLELAKEPTRIFADDDIAASFSVLQLQRLRNLRETAHGVLIDAQLTDGTQALVKVFTQITSQTPVKLREKQPHAYLLAELLHLPQAFTQTFETTLPVVLKEPLADRHISRALHRACGYRSRTKVPENLAVAIQVIPVSPESIQFFPILDMPAVEPYDWQLTLPSSDQCSRLTKHTTNGKAVQARCHRLTEIMVVMYLAGCDPPGNDDFVQLRKGERVGNTLFKLGYPRGCFSHNRRENVVTLDIVLSYVGKTCALPKGIFGRMKGLREVGWGVAARVKVLEKALTSLDGDAGCSGHAAGWYFFGGDNYS